MSESWLDCLKEHAIFELTAEEKEYADSLKKKQTPTSNINYSQHTSVIAFKDNTLYFAVRDRIRVLSLVEFKNAWREAVSKALYDKSAMSKSWIHSIPYKILETPDINFDIQSININKPGRLLAAVGEKNLSIICLPRQNYISSTGVSGRLIDCRSLQIGNRYYDTKSSGILKAEWHPLSETSTHIAVLGCDSMLRMFNVGEDISEPEQTFDLSPADKANSTQYTGGISVDDDNDEDAVSFTFSGKESEKGNGWESFTVYYALRNGHMYSLCPVLPYTSTVQREHLDNLGCISQVKFAKAEKEFRELSYLYQLQCEWIDGLLESAAKSNVGKKSIKTDVLTVYSKDIISFEAHRQGPFMVSQSEGLPRGVQVSDIYYANVDRVGIIALALSNGTVQNHILASDIEAQWQMPVKTTNEDCQKDLGILLSKTVFLPRATLYEEINIKPAHFKHHQKLKIVKNNRYDDSYFVYHAGGVSSIVMTEWLKGLKQLIDNSEKGNTGGVVEWMNNSKGSEATNLIISAPLSTEFVPIIGLAHIADHYLSYSLLAITGDFCFVSRELNLRRAEDNIEEASASRAIKAHLSHIGDDETDEDRYSCLLSLPAFTIPPQLSKLPNQASIVAPKSAGKEIVINEETTTFFSKSTDQIRRDAHELKKIGGVISNRIIAQQTEFENQVKYTQLLVDRIQACSSPEIVKAKEEKIKQVMYKHAKLQLRMDEYLRQLMDSYQPELSNDEKAWVAKLEELKQKLQGEGGYESRVKLLREQLNALNEKTSTSKSVTLPAGMTKAQLQSILRSTKEQSTCIDSVKERIESLTSRFESTKI
ncbi:hypothetical protein K501DRAFT_219550 [Backusella circina FSU 941]|nr:hypothetical protein K501DRAFT_219550 [Backusella circina FSU 941]